MRLLAIDMDGTCLNSRKQITDITMQAFKWAVQNDVMIVPATGRCLECLPYQLKQKNLFRYVISSNGAQVTDLKMDTVLYRKNIFWKEAYLLIHQCKDAGIGIAAHVGNTYFVQGKALSMFGRAVYGKDAANVKTVKNMLDVIIENGEHIQELQFFFLKPEARKAVEQILNRYAPVFFWAYTDKYVEIFAKDVSKGNALLRLANHLGVSKENIICIGDSQNDLSMFQIAGMKFAVGNAIDEIKKEADYVVASNDEDGVAEAIINYICLG